MKTSVRNKASDEAEAMHTVVREQQLNTLAAGNTEQLCILRHLPECEILRRMWRIYAMAFAAAERQEQAHQPVPPDGSCPQ